jgi:hypothetical protein
MWDFGCNVSEIRIDVNNKQGFLLLPEMNYPDMSSTIRCFTSADPEIEVIQTYVGGKLDTVYFKLDGEWQAGQAQLAPLEQEQL